MTRRNTLVFAALLPGAALAEPMERTEMFDEIFKASMEAKRGLTFFVKGQSIGGAITKIGNGFIEIRSQSASRIVIRLDSIDAVSMV